MARGPQRLFKEVLERNPDGPQVDECRFGLGRALELQGDIESARIAYQTIAAANGPLADDAQVQSGICLYNHADYEPAAKAFQSALERFPDSDLTGQARYWLGMCQVAQHDWDKAAQTLRSALDSHPQHALAPSMTFWLADTLRQSGDLKAAQEGYAKVVQNWPKCEWADDSLQMQIQFALAESQFDRVVSLGEQFRAQYPASPLKDQVDQHLGRGYLKQKQYAKAIEILKPLTQTASVADLPAEAGDAPENPASDTALEPEAVLQTIQYYLGLAYLGDQQYEAALEALAKVQAAPDNQELSGGVRLAQAMAYAGLNRHADAIEPLQQYLAAQPAGPEAAACRVQLINSLVQSNRLDEAFKIHAQVADQRTPPPGFAAATLRLAEAALEAGKYDDAVELFGILIEDGQPPEWASKGWSGLGWAQFRAGKAEAAVVAFERLLDQYPESSLAAEGAMMKAKALEQLDRSAEALEAYLLVVTTYGDSEHAASAMMEAAKLQEKLGRKAEAIPLLRRSDPGASRVQAIGRRTVPIGLAVGRAGAGRRSRSPVRTHLRTVPGRHLLGGHHVSAGRARVAGRPVRPRQAVRRTIDRSQVRPGHPHARAVPARPGGRLHPALAGRLRLPDGAAGTVPRVSLASHRGMLDCRIAVPAEGLRGGRAVVCQTGASTIGR